MGQGSGRFSSYYSVKYFNFLLPVVPSLCLWKPNAIRFCLVLNLPPPPSPSHPHSTPSATSLSTSSFRPFQLRSNSTRRATLRSSFRRSLHCTPLSKYSVVVRRGTGENCINFASGIGASERVGDEIPGVVVYLSFHAWVGWVSEIKTD